MPPTMTRADYIQLRDRYLPKQRKIVFVLESPPKSGLYFYNPDGSVLEPLFRAMMKDILEIAPTTKCRGPRADYRPDHLRGASN